MRQPVLHPPSVARARAGSAAAVLAALAMSACAPLPELVGPLPVRNQHPVQLTVAHLDPVPARVLPAGAAIARVDAAYSSLWLSGQGGGNTFRMDGETLRAAIDVRVGLGAGFELEAELPAGYAGGGGLDGFVTDWHDFWGLPDQGRTDFERDAYEVRAASNGSTVFALEPHELQPADLPLALRLELARTGPAVLAARAALEAPTGDDEAGFGNGGWDAALGLAAELRWPDVALVAHAHHAFASTPDVARAAGIGFRDVTALGLAGEYRLLQGMSLHLQMQYETSALRGLGFDRVADPHWLLWGGVRSALGARTTLEVAIGEDLNTYVSPDFTIWVGVATVLGPLAGFGPAAGAD